MRHRVITVLIAMLCLLGHYPVNASTNSAWQAKDAPIAISWGAAWTRLSSPTFTDAERLELTLSIDQRIRSYYTIWPSDADDSSSILQSYLERFDRSEYPNLTIVQPFDTFPTGKQQPLVLELDSASEAPLFEYVLPGVLAGGFAVITSLQAPAELDYWTVRANSFDISVTAVWSPLEDSGSARNSDTVANAPTIAATTPMASTDCSELDTWTSEVTQSLATLDSNVETLIGYGDTSGNPIPGTEYGALNVITEMDSLQLHLDTLESPDWAPGVLPQIRSMAQQVESSAGAIFQAVRTKPADIATIQSTLTNLRAMQTTLDSLVDVVDGLSATCNSQ